ncbi:MAG TPA: sugar phosphate isomerase/epimerase family protein [Candidatus Angelobacter sp.]|nr:sugar phosphate isomerase/epimerase family protein [Candidatus Angelobacter sp.]
MLRAVSSYVYIKQRLHPGLLDTLARGGAQAVELFAARGHFNYHEKEHVKELGGWFKNGQVQFHSMHSPIYTSNDFRSGAPPLNIVDTDKRNRIEAMDEIKRAIEVAEYVPFRFLVQHIGRTDEAEDPRKFEAALGSIEHLRAFARPLGVSLLVENTPSDLATPERLRELLRALHYPDLGVCFDTGHAHLMSTVHQAFDVLADRICSTHVHDNNHDRDSHLWPGEGSIDWSQTMQSLAAAPRTPAVLLEVEGGDGVDVARKMSEAYGRLEAAMVAG